MQTSSWLYTTFDQRWRDNALFTALIYMVTCSDTSELLKDNSIGTDTSVGAGPVHALTVTRQQEQINRHSLPVILNIESNRIASQTTLVALGDHRTDLHALEPPYTGSRAMLHIGHQWITSHHKYHILHAWWSQSIITYCKEKYCWDDTTINDISWRIVGGARKRCTPTQKMQTSNIMHAWLPTMHMQGHKHGVSSCPNCLHPDKNTGSLILLSTPCFKK
jgi:hypothetical protein